MSFRGDIKKLWEGESIWTKLWDVVRVVFYIGMACLFMVGCWLSEEGQVEQRQERINSQNERLGCNFDHLLTIEELKIIEMSGECR